MKLTYITRLISEKAMFGNTIIHVETYDGRHGYFGSVAAIYEKFTIDEIGISLAALWNYGLAEDYPYRNKFVTIRKGTIIRKKKNLK